ncbi:hypothetical protein BASA83_010388 [Batrachochytrium salamandrivorans]|nr:hypothetical protein BASA83_010388 [Batrachochytrium salamandrivorans]
MYVHRQTVQTVHDMFRSWQTGIHGATANTEHELHINVSEDMAKLALVSLRVYIVKSILPKLAYALPIPSIQRLKLVFDEFEQYSSEMIRDADTQTDANLLVSLTKAARADTDIGGGLTERELIGNIFILMFAGHETTAFTMVYALAMLATQPAAQQRMYEEITLVLKGGDPEYKHIHELAYTLAVMNETLRLFPSVIGVPKYVTNQQTLGKYTIPEIQVLIYMRLVCTITQLTGTRSNSVSTRTVVFITRLCQHATKTSEFFRDSAKSRAQSGHLNSQCTLLTTRNLLLNLICPSFI